MTITDDHPTTTCPTWCRSHSGDEQDGSVFHLATLSLSDLLQVEVFSVRDGGTGRLKPIEIEIVIDNDSLTVEQSQTAPPGGGRRHEVGRGDNEAPATLCSATPLADVLRLRPWTSARPVGDACPRAGRPQGDRDIVTSVRTT